MSPAERKTLAQEGMRLSKALAQLGVASRRASEELVFAGRSSIKLIISCLPHYCHQYLPGCVYSSLPSLSSLHSPFSSLSSLLSPLSSLSLYHF